MKSRIIGALGLLACLGPAVLTAQKPVTMTGDTVKVTVTIQKIDPATRAITFRGPEGHDETAIAGPDLKRFSELKVGDKVNLSYYESLVFTVRKSNGMTASDSTSLTASKGKLPGATLSQQTVMSVTVKAIDMAVPSITVVTPDGLTVTRKVKNKSNLDGVKAGDKIDITYTEAVIADVQRPK